MDKNNTILLQDYKIKDKIYIRNIEIRRNVNKNYIVVSHKKFIAYALLNFVLDIRSYPESTIRPTMVGPGQKISK